MADADELTHPVLGVLNWEADNSTWLGQRHLPDGGWLDVTIKPGEGDRHAFLKRAADIFAWALKNEREVLREAIQAELLELYNETWRGSDPVLDAKELEDKLEWHHLEIRDSDVLVEFTYGPGELFGGHGVAVELDAELKFHDVDLRG
jgi:hypothetical protein